VATTLRNALTYANKGQRQMVFALINTIFAQESADLALKQWHIATDQLREKFPRLAAMTGSAEHEVLSFTDFPKKHRVKIHSTNVLERLNGEIKRRSDVAGIFPNERAIRRLAGALLLEQSDEYAIQKRYMREESMAQLSENPTIRLPAAPALT
jgi:putative transposase